MSAIVGLKAKNGYLFFTGSINEGGFNNGGIVRLNSNCGALIVTKQQGQLNRVKWLLNKYSKKSPEMTDGLSDSFTSNLKSFFKAEFENNSSYKSMPLPFLLLIVGSTRSRVGIDLSQRAQLEHVFLRNRVTKILEKEGKKEFDTVIDINPPVPAGDIFYGECGIMEYLAQLIPCQKLSLDAVKLLACLSMYGFQHKDGFFSAGINMASMSTETGFSWTDAEELSLLENRVKEVNSMLRNGLSSFLFRESPGTRAM